MPKLQCSQCGTFRAAKLKNFPKAQGYYDKDGKFVIVKRICKVCVRNR